MGLILFPVKHTEKICVRLGGPEQIFSHLKFETVRTSHHMRNLRGNDKSVTILL